MTGIKSKSIHDCIETNGFHDSLLSLSNELLNKLPQKDKLTSYPLTLCEIADGLFDGSIDAAYGLLELLTTDYTSTKELRSKIRMHLFIRNLDGIRRGMAMSKGNLLPPTLYDGTRPICKSTGAINLEVHYCQECGEIYYCGYKNHTGRTLFISNDDAIDNSISPDRLIIHIPQDDVSYNHNGWDERWFNGFTGEISSGIQKDWIRVYCKILPHDKTSLKYEYPRECVQCEVNWSTMPKPFPKSPIRTMGTGYNKFSQVIIEQLMGSLREANDSEKNSKIVIFSDSRRDAEIISADLELNHYKDTVRALTEKHLDNAQSSNTDLLDLISKLEEAKKAGIGK